MVANKPVITRFQTAHETNRNTSIVIYAPCLLATSTCSLTGYGVSTPLYLKLFGKHGAQRAGAVGLHVILQTNWAFFLSFGQANITMADVE
ncbi:hypothetical protein [Pectobacterium peruviense]|uniref:hypothetical protein n=1 Tax=Pectobacterium peruviense TaxID=2066479 RepID=UPI00142DFE05|nr:hypothetical protein [Pectobacterium peruviense]